MTTALRLLIVNLRRQHPSAFADALAVP